MIKKIKHFEDFKMIICNLYPKQNNLKGAKVSSELMVMCKNQRQVDKLLELNNGWGMAFEPKDLPIPFSEWLETKVKERFDRCLTEEPNLILFTDSDLNKNFVNSLTLFGIYPKKLNIAV